MGCFGVSATFTAVRVVRPFSTRASFDDARHVIGDGADEKRHLCVVGTTVCRTTEHDLTARVTCDDGDSERRFGWLIGTRRRAQPLCIAWEDFGGRRRQWMQRQFHVREAERARGTPEKVPRRCHG
jgi:hypothetical protein